MPPAASPALADRFARLVEGLRRAIAARGVGLGLALPLMLLLWSRLRRTAERFARLAAKGPRRHAAAAAPPPALSPPGPAPAAPAAPAATRLRVARAPAAAGRLRRLAVAAPAGRSGDGRPARRSTPGGAAAPPALPNAGRPPAAGPEPVLGRSRGPSAAGPSGGPVPPRLPSPTAVMRAAPYPQPASRHPAGSRMTARRPCTPTMFRHRNIQACEGEASVLRSFELKRRLCRSVADLAGEGAGP